MNFLMRKNQSELQKIRISDVLLYNKYNTIESWLTETFNQALCSALFKVNYQTVVHTLSTKIRAVDQFSVLIYVLITVTVHFSWL